MAISDLILATHNQGKLAEFRHALAPLGVNVSSAAEHKLPEPDETGATFVANAVLKAKAAASVAGRPCLADDSGLAIDALGGAPGIFSARWAGPGKDFTVAFDRIIDEVGGLQKAQSTRAAFVAVLALIDPDQDQPILAEGRVEGTLTFPPRGDAGFGYDPIFIPDGDSRTFAEMSKDEKAQYSHRMRALRVLAPLAFGGDLPE